MNLIIISSTLILCIAISFSIKHSNKEKLAAEQNFWEKERKANFVRKKPLDDLDYITIPDEILHMKPHSMNPEISDYLNELKTLTNEKIVNLTGISNTDLKLAYGTANITILTEYDFNYTKMVIFLQKLAQQLSECGENELAIKVLEFAVSTGSDVSQSYYLLSSLYDAAGTPKKKKFLIQQAQSIHSIMKDNIIRTLKASS